MQLIEPISNLKNQLISANHRMIAGQIILALAVLFLIGSIILIAQLDKKNDLLRMQAKKEGRDFEPVKYTDGIQGTCLVTMILSLIMLIPSIDILAYSNTSYTILHAARNTVDQSSFVKGAVTGYPRIYQDKDINDYVNKISVDWNYGGSDDEQKLIDVTHNSKQVIYTSKSKIGRAYLRVGHYIDNQTKHPVNLTWTLKPYLVKASYDDENGHHNLVCRVDNKKVPEGKNQVVVKY